MDILYSRAHADFVVLSVLINAVLYNSVKKIVINYLGEAKLFKQTVFFFVVKPKVTASPLGLLCRVQALSFYLFIY